MVFLRGARPRSTAVAALAVCASLAAGCGSSDDDGGGTTGSTSTVAARASTASSAGSDAVLQQAQRIVQAATGGLVYARGYDAIDPAAIKPLTSFQGPAPSAPPKDPIKLAVIGCAPVGGCLNVTKDVAAVATKLGWSVAQASGDGTPSSYQKLFNTAMTQGVDAIVAVAVPGVVVAQQLAEAKSKGIVTIASNSVPASGPGYTGYVDGREPLSKMLLASWIITDSDGKGSALLTDAQGRPDLGVATAANFLEQCSGCSVKVDTWPSTDFLNPVKAGQRTQALVRANPNAGYLMWPTGGLPLQPAVQAISQAGRAGDLALISSDLDPPSLTLLQKGGVKLLTSQSQGRLSLATVDAVIKGLAEQRMPTSDAWGIGVGIVDAEHAPKQASYPAIDAYVREQFDYVAPYQQAWGVDLSALG